MDDSTVPSALHRLGPLSEPSIAKFDPGDGHDEYHAFSFLGPPYTPSDPTGPDGSRITAGSAHDDSCVDNFDCVSLGFGALQGSHGSWPRGLPYQAHHRVRHSLANMISPYAESPSNFLHDGLLVLPPHLQFREMMNSAAQRDWAALCTPASNSVNMSADEVCSVGSGTDCRSCDTSCSVGDHCTDAACEKTAITCEAATAAATLQSLGAQTARRRQQQQQQRRQQRQQREQKRQPEPSYSFPDPMSMPFELPFHDPTEAHELSVSPFWREHLLREHVLPQSLSCMVQPCPAQDPAFYSHCHFPSSTFPTDPFPTSVHQHTYVPEDLSLMQHGCGEHECGAENSSLEAWMDHCWSKHFSGLEEPDLNLLGTPSRDHTADHVDGEHGHLMQERSSDSSTTALDTMLSSPVTLPAHSPFTPLSPMTTALEPSQRCLTPISRRRSSSLASSPINMSSADENKCLWHDLPGSSLCGHVFSDPTQLYNHVVADHIKNLDRSRANGFCCGWEGCLRGNGEKGFPQRSKIERHMQTHIGHKPHTCPTCLKSFSAKQALEQHILIHTSEKPLQCNICSKTFRQQSALTMHKRTHTGEKPLQCDICGKAFSESSNLSKHRRTHEAKGRFRCVDCGKDFHRQDQLRRHLRLHRKGEKAEPEDSETSIDQFNQHPKHEADGSSGTDAGRAVKRTKA